MITVYFKHHVMVENLAKLLDLFKKIDPIVAEQQKLLDSKDKLTMSRTDVAKFLNSFYNLEIAIIACQQKLHEIQASSQLQQRALIMHYQAQDQ